MYHDLMFWEHFSEDVCHHILSGAKLDIDVPIRDCLMNEMEANVNMFGMSMIVVVCGKMDGSFVVAMESGGCQ
jgi:hypothetical protein